MGRSVDSIASEWRGVPPVAPSSTGVPARDASSTSCQKSVWMPAGAPLYTGATVMTADARDTAANASSSSGAGKPDTVRSVSAFARWRTFRWVVRTEAPAASRAACAEASIRSVRRVVVESSLRPVETATISIMGLPFERVGGRSGLRRGLLLGRLPGGEAVAVRAGAGCAAGARVLTGVVAGDQPLVGGGLRDVGRSVRGELPAQGGHDLLAQDVDLLEDRLERQAGVVHEEQLALVVACPLAEPGVALDDLLRRSDRQRGLLAEVLQAGAVAVDGRVVEVGAELAHRLLRVPVHVDLAAQTHERLIRTAVAVVLVALAVEVHHARGVAGGPEDVVVEEAVAVVGGLLRDLRAADRAVAHEGRQLVQRPRGDGEGGERRADVAVPG